jgi:colanic acid biosynthesis glycosyl transferase WcaI
MKILLLNQFFWPDLAATSQLLTDLARHLADGGNEVTVICARGSYGGDDATNAPPVRIIRLPGMAFGRSPLTRMLSYGSFFGMAGLCGFCIPKPDLVISLTTPPLLSVLGLLLQKCRGVRHYIWEMDVYPDVAVDVGVLQKGSPITRVIGAIADYGRKQAEGVIALGECMRERLIARGIMESKIHIAENWADGELFYPVGRRFTVIYSGNLGLAHDVDTIAVAMNRLKNDRRFYFVFSGGGARRKSLEEFCRRNAITNTSFLPYYSSRDQLNDLLASADLGLVTQSASCLGSMVPSKVYALMAAGLPSVFIGPRSATTGLVLERFRSGWHIDCGDSDALVALLESLVSDREYVRRTGASARAAFLANYDLPIGVRRISGILQLSELVESTRVGKAGA